MSWRINFFYGNSKNIKEKILDQKVFSQIVKSLDLVGFEESDLLTQIKCYVESIDMEGLQMNWTNSDRSRIGPIKVIDDISNYAKQLIERLNRNPFALNGIQSIVEHQLINGNGKIDNKKLVERSEIVLAGMLIGSIFNSIASGRKVNVQIPAMQD